MDDETRAEWLNDHIPYRLHAVDGLRWFMERVRTSDRFLGVRLVIDGSEAAPWELTNRIVDAGLVFCRWMAEFLGVHVPRTSTGLQQKGRAPGQKGEDVWLRDFTGADLAVTDVRADELAGPAEVQSALAYAIRLGSRAVAHPVGGKGKPAVDIRSVHLAALAIPLLVKQHLYDRLGMIVPDYSFPTLQPRS